ncbi:MAG: ABC transporter ATP-binding protein [Alphaproteobacteria bacterium]|nr:ABC transporter ATP-binding protein [Alphaproteobacteria bacterium]
METLPKHLLPFFLHFIKPYKWYVVGLFSVALSWATHVSLLPYVLKLLIDTVTAYSNDLPHLGRAVMWPVCGYVGLSVMIGITFRFYDYLVMKLLPNIKRDVQQQMLMYLEGHSYTYFQNNFAGSLSNKISDMMRGISEIILMTTDTFLASFLGVCAAMVTMYFVQPIFAVVLFVWAFIYFYVSWLLSKKGQAYATLFAEARSTLTGKQVDSIGNMVNIRLFARRSFEVAYVKRYTDDTVDKDRQLQWYLLKVRIFQFSSMTAVIACMVITLVYERSLGNITVGDFVLILTLNGRLLESLWNAANQMVRFSQEVGTCKQALSIITVPHDLEDVPNAPALLVSKGRIEFDQVTFCYQRNTNLFENKNVVIAPAAKIGLVGFSGSGKTTFVHLILRFFDVESGRILIDGQDIANVTQDSLRDAIAMIPQDTSLFHRSLMDNIRYGRPDATDEDVIEASKKAHCHDFILQLPEGYESLVGERGIKLSGGQRQRIAIARAMLKNAPILILDEATSALDSVTEKLIQEALHTLMQGRTTIVIAHRLSTLSEMDRILVFDKGHIIEDGTHEELLVLGGHYAKMWHMQAGGFLPESDV